MGSPLPTVLAGTDQDNGTFDPGWTMQDRTQWAKGTQQHALEAGTPVASTMCRMILRIEKYLNGFKASTHSGTESI